MHSRRVPETRDEALAVIAAVRGYAELLNPDQVAAIRRLYRLDDPRTVAELAATGELPDPSSDLMDRVRDQISFGRFRKRAKLLKIRFLITQLSKKQAAQLRDELSQNMEPWLAKFLFSGNAPAEGSLP